MIHSLVQAVPLALVASVPLLLASCGGVVAQRAGIVNLGIEGNMLVAALAAAIAAQQSASITAGFIAGVGASLAFALLFSFFVIDRKADQIVTGTAMNLFAHGITGAIWRAREASLSLHDMPHVHRDFLTPVAWLLVPTLLALFLWRSSAGLRLRACGENPDAVRASGHSPEAIRRAAIAIEAVLAGVAGAALPLAISSGFSENMTAGRGFVALAIVILGRWSAGGVVAGTMVFGIAAALQYALQAGNLGIPYHLLLAAPYVLALLLLAALQGRAAAPAALGR